MKFSKTAVVFWRILSPASSLQLMLVQWLRKDAFGSAPKVSLDFIIFVLCTSLANCLKGCLNLARSGHPQMRLGGLNFILSYASSDKWRRASEDHVVRLKVCSYFATNLVSALGAFCTELVPCGVFESFESSFDSAHLPFSGRSIDNTCGEGSAGVESQLCYTSHWVSNWP